MHPAPGVHISTAGCTILGGMHPVCARFLSHLLLLYIGRVHGAISGCTVLWEVHPASAQNKSLISDTLSVSEKVDQGRKGLVLCWVLKGGGGGRGVAPLPNPPPYPLFPKVCPKRLPFENAMENKPFSGSYQCPVDHGFSPKFS